MFERILNSGNKDHYSSWEIMISRKLNFNSLVGIFNMIVGMPIFIVVSPSHFVPLAVFAIFNLIATILLNKHKNYVWGAYCFFIAGFIFLSFICLFMGKETYIILFFFPMLISIVQMFGRKELFSHLFILSIILLSTIGFIAYGYQYNLLKISFSEQVTKILLIVNLFLSFTTTLAVTIINVKEQLIHEDKLRKTTKEKELLLAEVFHRVKNNLNIVTSILNLKKNTSEDSRVQEAIEECRSRIYSIALVHETIFNNKKEVGLKFNEYVERLVKEVANGLAEQYSYEIEMHLDEVELNLTKAVPCGMILNEILTNAFKHAQQKDRKLMINISLLNEGDSFKIIVRDNGGGINNPNELGVGSLGMELINSLADQINTSGKFYNDNGLVFEMKVDLDPI